MAQVPITEESNYLIKGSAILAIMDTLRSNIPCAFNQTVVTVENMLSTVRPIQINSAPIQEAPQSAPVLPSVPNP